MANIAEILTEKEARNFAINQLGFFLQEVLPDRSTYMDSSDYPEDTTAFTVIDILNTPNSSGDMGLRPIDYTIDETGKETYVYKDKLSIDLLTYNGDAYDDLSSVRRNFNNKYLKYKHFGSTNGLVGITDIGSVIDSRVAVYGSQETRAGARLRLAIPYVYKVVDTYGEYVDQIDWTNTVKSADDEITNNGHVE